VAIPCTVRIFESSQSKIESRHGSHGWFMGKTPTISIHKWEYDGDMSWDFASYSPPTTFAATHEAANTQKSAAF